MLPRPRAVVFDMDGLLLNTENLRMLAVDDCARLLDAPVRRDVFAAFVGGASPQARAALDAHMSELPPEFWTVYRQCAERRMADVRPMPGALALLDDLAARAIPCAIATSATHAAVARYGAALDVPRRFAAVIAKGDYECAKPAPDAYRAAAARLGVAPHTCWALEDSYNGVRAAAAAGMTTIMAPNIVPATADIRALCAVVVDGLDDVRALLD